MGERKLKKKTKKKPAEGEKCLPFGSRRGRGPGRIKTDRKREGMK